MAPDTGTARGAADSMPMGSSAQGGGSAGGRIFEAMRRRRAAWRFFRTALELRLRPRLLMEDRSPDDSRRFSFIHPHYGDSSWHL